MIPVFMLWPLALLVALCGMTAHVVEADGSSSAAGRVRAFVEARVASDDAHAAETAGLSDAGAAGRLVGRRELQPVFDARPRPALFAAGAPVGTFTRTPHRFLGGAAQDRWRAAWHRALDFDATRALLIHVVDRVSDQIREELIEACLITEKSGRILRKPEFDVVFIELEFQLRVQLVENGPRLDENPTLVGLSDSRELQHVIEQLLHMPTGLLDAIHEMQAGGVERFSIVVAQES